MLSSSRILTLEQAVQGVLEELGCSDEVVRNTPRRFSKALIEMISSQVEPHSWELATFDEPSSDEMITLTGIQFVSVCEHHLLPFFGYASVGYLPQEVGSGCRRLVGLSKIPRLVQGVARKLTIQERLTQEIAQTIHSALNPLGCGVILEAIHTCAVVRGVRMNRLVMKTSALTGIFHRQDVKEEFLKLCGSSLLQNW